MNRAVTVSAKQFVSNSCDMRSVGEADVEVEAVDGGGGGNCIAALDITVPL